VKTKLQANIESLTSDQDLHCVNEDMTDLLSGSEKDAQRVSNILQKTLVFARVDGNKKQFFDINNCIRSSYKRLHKQISEKARVTLELHEVPEIDINVGKINHLLSNLLINAAQSIESHGSINVLSHVKDDHIHIAICDNGRGIEDHAMAKIFDPFYTSKKEAGGTGLGLAISHDIVSEHGGKIKVSSTVGKGSIFTISLPTTHAVIH